MMQEDLPWIWAAYRLGAFPGLPDGAEKAELYEAFTRWASLYSGVTLLLAPNRERDGSKDPVALVLFHKDERGYGITVRVVWFPWATLRNRLEAATKYLVEARKVASVRMYVDPSDIPFMNRLAEHGVARRVGWHYDWNGPGEHAPVFQSQKR